MNKGWEEKDQINVHLYGYFQDSSDIETHNKSVVMEERGTRRKIIRLKTVHEFHIDVSTILLQRQVR